MSEQGFAAEALIQLVDARHRSIAAQQHELFRLIADCDRPDVWRDSGARDLAHWLAMRYGISEWKSRRWIACAHALAGLPLTAAAFSDGSIGIDKVVELTRFATADTEARLIRWARDVSAAAIRHRADVMARRSIEDAREADRSRRVSWWYFDEGRRFGLEAELPAADGARVARALDRMADRVPRMPDEDEDVSVEARRADALVALCSGETAADPDTDRATVVIHAGMGSITSGEGNCEIEGGPVIDPETARRLLCSARLQVVTEDATGQATDLGRLSRSPSASMMRQLRYRDRECRFPGCGARQFTQAHHIVWWERGGRTDLDNLVVLCFFHHKLVHEYGWSLRWGGDGLVAWSRPDGSPYLAGPAPPEMPVGEELGLVGSVP